jgi:hypothetical protein
MNLLKWLLLLRKLDLQELLAYPKDVTNSPDCRRWMLAILDAADVLTDLTSVKFDDEIIETIDSIVQNDAAWDAIHGLFVSVVAEEPEDMAVTHEIDGIAAKYGFNPAIIMLIIQAISMLLQLIRSRRK